MKKRKILIAAMITTAAISTFALSNVKSKNGDFNFVERTSNIDLMNSKNELIVVDSTSNFNLVSIHAQKKMSTSVLESFDLASISNNTVIVDYYITIDKTSNCVHQKAVLDDESVIFDDDFGYAYNYDETLDEIVFTVEGNVLTFGELSNYSDYEMCGLWKKIKKAAKSVVSAVKKTALNVVDEIKDLGSTAVSKVKKAGSKIKDAFKKGGSTAVKAAKDLYNTAKEEIENIVDKVKEEIEEIEDGLQEIFESAKENINEIITYVKDYIEEAKDKLETYVNEIKEEIIIEFHYFINDCLKVIATFEIPFVNFDYNDIDNYKDHIKLDQPDGLIYNQHVYGEWAFGKSSNLADAGCEVIAGYNMAYSVGKKETLPKTTALYEALGIRLDFARGYFGSNPYQIDRFLSFKGINFIKADNYSSFTNSVELYKNRDYHVIISSWNGVGFDEMVHTYYIDKQDMCFTEYNYTCDSKADTSDSVFSFFNEKNPVVANFMCAYFVLK